MPGDWMGLPSDDFFVTVTGLHCGAYKKQLKRFVEHPDEFGATKKDALKLRLGSFVDVDGFRQPSTLCLRRSKKFNEK
jgi:hypothetical protein